MTGRQKVAIGIICTLLTGAIIVMVQQHFINNKSVPESKTEKKIKNIKEKDISRLKDGEYTGEANGYGGIIKVNVTIKNGKIAKVDVISHNETPEYFKAAKKIIDNMIAKNSFDVDSVSGATISSNALKEAVADALSKAGLKNTVSKLKNTKKNGLTAKNIRVSAQSLRGSFAVPIQGLKDGDYTGSASGWSILQNGGNIPITVVVHVRGGVIASIDVSGAGETPSFMAMAKGVIPQIIRGGKVDTITNATFSSRGIINAVNIALSKAAKNSSSGTVSTVQVNDESNGRGSDNHQTDSTSKPGNDTVNGDNTNNTNKTYINLDIIKGIKDGDYRGSASGWNIIENKGNIPVSVVVHVRGGKFSGIDVSAPGETPEFLALAKKVIPNIMAGGQVDTVTGATFSSLGIIDAVNKAIEVALKNDKDVVQPNSPSKPKKNHNETGEEKDKNTGRLDSSKIIFNENTKLKPGSYRGVATRGLYYNDPKRGGANEVTVVIGDDGKIKKITSLVFRDDIGNFTLPASVTYPIIRDRMFKMLEHKSIKETLEMDKILTKKIDENKSGKDSKLPKDYDTLTGATETCSGHISAVIDALRKSAQAYSDK
ncbi:FMN-binding protein [Eubacteriales bacterium KG127]